MVYSTSILKHLPIALLTAGLTLACGPKEGGGDTGDSDSSGTSGGSGSTSFSDSTSLPTQECTPGEDIDDSPGDCMECFCSEEGLVVCSRCAPTTSGTDGTTTDATSDVTATGPDTTSNGDTDSTTGGGSSLPDCADLAPSDPFDLVAAQVAGDELVVDVAYSGGCETHGFTLCFDSIDLVNNVTNLAIDHDAQGDACNAYPMETRKLDLTPLRQLGPSPFPFVLLGAPGDGLVYEF